MVYSYNEILHNNKKEQITVTCKKTDESHRHNVEWKKPDTKEYVVYDSIDRKFSNGGG